MYKRKAWRFIGTLIVTIALLLGSSLLLTKDSVEACIVKYSTTMENVASHLPEQLQSPFNQFALDVYDLLLLHPALAGGCNKGNSYKTYQPPPNATKCCYCKDDGAGDYEGLYCSPMPGDGPWSYDGREVTSCPKRDTGGGGGPGPTNTPVSTAQPTPGSGGNGDGGGQPEKKSTPIPYTGLLFSRPRLLEGECADVDLTLEFEEFVEVYADVLDEHICRISVARALYDVINEGQPPGAVTLFYEDLTGLDARKMAWMRKEGYITEFFIISPHYQPVEENFCPKCPVYRALYAPWMNMLLRGSGLSEVEYVVILNDVTENLERFRNIWRLSDIEYEKMRQQLALELTEFLQSGYEKDLGPPWYDLLDGMDVIKAKLLFDIIMELRQ